MVPCICQVNIKSIPSKYISVQVVYEWYIYIYTYIAKIGGDKYLSFLPHHLIVLGQRRTTWGTGLNEDMNPLNI